MSNPVLEAEQETEESTNPYYYGWREVTHELPDGTFDIEQIPLTELDLLHPEEGDVIPQNTDHSRYCAYLFAIIEAAIKGHEGLIAFTDMLVDWQHPVFHVRPHCPDVVLFDGMKGEWDDSIGVVPVRDLSLQPLFAIEVVSSNSRNNDFKKKFDHYYRVGVPFYVIVDRTRSSKVKRILGYRWTPEGYEEVAAEAGRGIWLKEVKIGITAENGRMVCRDERGEVIPTQAEALEIQKVRADEAEAKAKKERAKAAKEKTRADAQRELDLKRINELEAELQRLRTTQPPLQNPESP